MKPFLVHQASIQLPSGWVSFKVRRSQRAKRLLLKVHAERGIELVVPKRMSMQGAQAFMIRQKEWLNRAWQKQQEIRTLLPTRQLITGETLPLLGGGVPLMVTVNPASKRAKIKYELGALTLDVPTRARVRPLLVRWYKDQARHFFSHTSHTLASRLNVTFQRIAIGNQKTQWGSCSAKGRLSYNWRLLLAPKAIARYVAAHEVAHIKHRNHSPAFWQTVALLDPNFQSNRRWLKQRGTSLQL